MLSSKCTFAQPQVEYLGHIVSARGVSTDPAKIESIQSWPTPHTPTEHRGFLGLTGYYRRFIKNMSLSAGCYMIVLRRIPSSGAHNNSMHSTNLSTR